VLHRDLRRSPPSMGAGPVNSTQGSPGAPGLPWSPARQLGSKITHQRSHRSPLWAATQAAARKPPVDAPKGLGLEGGVLEDVTAVCYCRVPTLACPLWRNPRRLLSNFASLA
jgi:hypothetical protein